MTTTDEITSNTGENTMTRSRRTIIAALSLALACGGTAAFMQDAQDGQVGQAEPTVAKVGEKAPGFTLTDLDGKEVSLSDFEGKIVVLAWYNPQCPYEVYHYSNGHTQALVKELKELDENIVWLNINSGGPGKQGNGVELNKKYRDDWDLEMPILLDEEGTVGRTYQARTTPHNFVISAEGILVYQGALDNAPHGRVREGEEKINYVKSAVQQLLAGETVVPSETRPYG
jgi:peroxiredoxin